MTTGFKLLILAGGLGTRLRTVVSDKPKALAPAEGIPFLNLLLQSYYRQGLRDFVFSVHYEAEQIVQHLKSTQLPKDLRYSIVKEPAPLGTGGALGFAVEQLSSQQGLLVCNGDTYLDSGATELCSHLETHGTAQSWLSVVPHADPARYGAVEFNESGQITSFAEKNKTPGQNPQFINAGLYFLSAAHLKMLPSGAYSLEKDFFPSLLKQQQLLAFPIQSRFIDIGTPEDYAQFCSMLKSGVIKNSWM